MADSLLDASTVADCVNEFYNTHDANRIKQLDEVLCKFKADYPCDRTIATCILLMSPNHTHHVKYFGAISIYDIIRKRSNECIADPSVMGGLKKMLIDSLTTSAHIQMQSMTNKLSSSLALLALYSIPDIWPQPVHELTILWAATPELLLRVLAELAAEFSNIQMPTTQRSVLKTELHRISEDIIRIIETVLQSSDTTPSVRQAAVECVEQWVQLPGTSLEQWTHILSIVFVAVSNDNAALTNLLNILSGNDDLSTLEQLVLDICHYITTVVAQNVCKELEDDGDSEEAVSLTSALCTLAEKIVPTIVKHTKKEMNNTDQSQMIIIRLADFFSSLSTWPGSYPIDECVSDLPAQFWNSIREDLMAYNDENNKQINTKVMNLLSNYYANICRCSIDKLAYPNSNQYFTYDKDQKEQFESYRRSRCEDSLNAYYVVGNETLNFLNQQLEQYISEGDVCRIECVLWLWYNVADYLSESDYSPICNLLQQSSRLSAVDSIDEDEIRMGHTLMRLLYAVSHLVQAHENATELEIPVFRIILSYVNHRLVSEEALRTLEKYTEDRPDSLQKVGDDISNRCYEYFVNGDNAVKARLLALKCIGYVLSMKRPTTVMEILSKILAPYMIGMDNSIQVLTEEELARITFQIDIFSYLFASLVNKKELNFDGEEPATVTILLQAMPVFDSITLIQGNHTMIGNRVCEAVRNAVVSLPSPLTANTLSFVCQLLDRCLLSNAASACALAKSTVLVYGKDNQMSSQLCSALSRWFEMFAENSQDTSLEEWLSLMHQVFKKDWKMLRTNGEQSLPAIAAAIKLSGMALSSTDPAVVRLASQVLSTIATQSTSYGDETPRLFLANHGAVLVRAIFERVQCEMMRTTVESLADVLYFFAKQFPEETRVVIEASPHGNSPMVAAMFREVGNVRHFKQMTLRLNLVARQGNNTRHN